MKHDNFCFRTHTNIPIMNLFLKFMQKSRGLCKKSLKFPLGNQLDDSQKVNAKMASISQSTGKGAICHESDGSC